MGFSPGFRGTEKQPVRRHVTAYGACDLNAPITCMADFDAALKRLRDRPRWLNAAIVVWAFVLELVSACEILGVPAPVNWQAVGLAVVFVPLPFLFAVGRARQRRVGLVCPQCHSPLIRSARSHHLIRTTGKCTSCNEPILRDPVSYPIAVLPHERTMQRMPQLNLVLACSGAMILVLMLFVFRRPWLPARARHLAQAVGLLSSGISFGIGLYGLLRYGRRFLTGLLIGGASFVIWFALLCQSQLR